MLLSSSGAKGVSVMPFWKRSGPRMLFDFGTTRFGFPFLSLPGQEKGKPRRPRWPLHPASLWQAKEIPDRVARLLL